MLKFGLLSATCGAAGLCAALSSTEKLEAKWWSGGMATLKAIVPLNHDARLFRFSIGSGNDYLVPTASCLSAELIHLGLKYSRYYTPVNPLGTNYIDLLVKLYPDGMMTPLIWPLKLGDKMRFRYWERDRWVPNKYKRVGMLAGGVGIAPILQLIREVVTNPYDQTKCQLLYVNKTEDDILLKEELDRLAFEYPEKLEVNYLLTRPKDETTPGGKAKMSSSELRRVMPPPEEKTKIFVCGPVGFYSTLCGGIDGLEHWTGQIKSHKVPGLVVYDSVMDEKSLLSDMGYGLNQVAMM